MHFLSTVTTRNGALHNENRDLICLGRAMTKLVYIAARMEEFNEKASLLGCLLTGAFSNCAQCHRHSPAGNKRSAGRRKQEARPIFERTREPEEEKPPL